MTNFCFLASMACSLTLSSTYLISATSEQAFLRPRLEKSYSVDANGISTASVYKGQMDWLTYNSCNSLETCEDCTSTYTCHWCERTESCHARGSPFGCVRGDSCSGDVNPHKNNTCALQTTCFDCTEASRFCHWCEHDNACHAVASRFGCAIGVDCYSNDQCRRSEPEPLPFPSSPIKAVFASLNHVPLMGFIVILFLGFILFASVSCCFYVTSCKKDARSNLTEPSVVATSAPMSEIDEPQFISLTESAGEDASTEVGNQSNEDCGVTRTNLNSDEHTDISDCTQVDRPSQQSNERTSTIPELQINNHQERLQPTGESVNLNLRMDGAHHNSTDENQIRDFEDEMGPLLRPSSDGVVDLTEDPTQTKPWFPSCSTLLYYFSLIIVALIVGASVFFYPQIPIVDVCNDEVAWTKIMKNMITFKFDASFEILASFSNPNHISATLESGKGSFFFDGKQFGSFEIPPVNISSMAITDFMIIVHVSPADRTQAINLVKAYHMGSLVVDVNFEGALRAPILFGYSREIVVNDIEVDVSAASDRSVCHCQKWEDDETESVFAFLEMMESQTSFL